MPQLDEQKIIPVTNDRYRQHFHIMTNGGWVNHHWLKSVACEQAPFWWVFESQFA